MSPCEAGGCCVKFCPDCGQTVCVVHDEAHRPSCLPSGEPNDVRLHNCDLRRRNNALAADRDALAKVLRECRALVLGDPRQHIDAALAEHGPRTRGGS